MIIPLPPGQLPASVGEVLGDFRRTHQREAWLWVRRDGAWQLAAATAPTTRTAPDAHAAVLPDLEDDVEARVEVEGGTPDAARLAEFLSAVVRQLLQHDYESRWSSHELAERYEEITLLYSISEILGSVVSLQEAAATILSEVADILGVQRAALWVYNAELERLEQIASVGEMAEQAPIPVSDGASATATVFRERRPLILAPGDTFPRTEVTPGASRDSSFLSVPISYTPPEGETRTIGVINLIGRDSASTFSAGDQKLMAAIASQIGAALENSRLVAQILDRERVERELELAHDLQLKLLPSIEQFNGVAEVAARCVPAESVGGDFYHLFRLPGRRVGVMIGDVSSHGFSAALIMALTMSAVGIHASEADSPAEVLARTHRALIGELETTEMYLTLFYGVIDPARGVLTYANAGHSHAFRISDDGTVTRLAATDPPFGLVDGDGYQEEVVAWRSGRDLLFLFTDGLSDSLGLGEVEGERAVVKLVADGWTDPVGTLLERVYSVEAVDSDLPPDDRTAVLVRA